ncbi:hypothetical protein B0H13DRAFT_2450873, partial [Mycena leptocephala]
LLVPNPSIFLLPLCYSCCTQLPTADSRSSQTLSTHWFHNWAAIFPLAGRRRRLMPTASDSSLLLHCMPQLLHSACAPSLSLSHHVYRPAHPSPFNPRPLLPVVLAWTKRRTPAHTASTGHGFVYSTLDLMFAFALPRSHNARTSVPQWATPLYRPRIDLAPHTPHSLCLVLAHHIRLQLMLFAICLAHMASLLSITHPSSESV